MKVRVTLLAVGILLGGCVTQDLQETTSVTCPRDMGDLGVLVTESQVVKCLGESNHVTSRPDGRHTKLYKYDGGVVVVFLFDKNGEVIRYRAYQDELTQ